jgi:hypothetical protein
MKAFVFAISLILLIGFGYPMLNEDTGNLCSALERRLISLAYRHDSDQSGKIILGSLQSSLSNGSVVRIALTQQHPDMPASLTCGLTYWRAMLDPGDVKRELNPEALREIPQVKSAAPTDDAQRELDRAKDAQKAMRALSSPVAPSLVKPGEEQAPNYKPGDRRDMNRLIENAR